MLYMKQQNYQLKLFLSIIYFNNNLTNKIMEPTTTIKLFSASHNNNMSKFIKSFTKIKKSAYKFRLKTDEKEDDQKSGKIKNTTEAFSIDNNKNLEKCFFRKNHSKSFDKNGQEQHKIKFEEFKFINFLQKPSKKTSFNVNLSYINCSGNLNSYACRNNSIDKIYSNSNFSFKKESKPKSFKSKRNDSQTRKDHKKKFEVSSPIEILKKQETILKDSNHLVDNVSKIKLENDSKLKVKDKNSTVEKNNRNPSYQEVRKNQFDLIKFPISSDQIIKKYGSLLNKYQIAELQNYDKIYYLNKTTTHKKNGENNHGYDDKKGYYIVQNRQHIAYRFQILQLLGKGSFGQVYKAYDHKNNQQIALKIIKNKKISNNQAKIQLQILQYLKQADQQNYVNIVQIKQHLIFRNHHVMIFQLLSINLYELIKSNNFLPLSNELVRRISIQILSSLLFLYKHNIIHCDIKPQNILLKNIQKSGIKIIDFGSSCFTNQKLYSYIQSRYYRAPQIILGYDYSTQIDMWSFGCVAAQLKLSYPIFYGQNQDEQIALITEVIGKPVSSFYKKTKRGDYYFNSSYVLKTNDQQQIIPQSRPIDKLFDDTDFVDFLKKIFLWNPKERMTPLEALKHNWILKGLPNDIKQQHLQFLQEQKLLLQHIKNQKLIKQKIDDSIEIKKITFSKNALIKGVQQFQ